MSENILEPKCYSQPPADELLSEAEWFHRGVQSGLTIYARESGTSTLKSKNELLARLLTEENWRAIESYKKSKKPDWRIGLLSKPKYQKHAWFSQKGVIIGTYPSGFGNITDNDGVIMIQMATGDVLLDKADNWVTA